MKEAAPKLRTQLLRTPLSQRGLRLLKPCEASGDKAENDEKTAQIADSEKAERGSLFPDNPLNRLFRRATGDMMRQALAKRMPGRFGGEDKITLHSAKG